MTIQKLFALLLMLLYFPTTTFGQHFTQQFADRNFWISNTIVPKFDSNRFKRSDHECEELQIRLMEHTNWTLCIFRESILTYDFLNERTTVIEEGKDTVPLHELDFVRITGYIIGYKQSSKVDGYLLHDKLLGRIFIKGELFVIEELIMYLPGLTESDHSVIFNASDRADLNNQYEYKRKRRSKRDSQSDGAFYQGKEMSIAAHVDPPWYILANKYCRKRALFGVVHLIYVMNSVFRSTDFFSMGRPTNIGFYLKKITLYKNNYKMNVPPYIATRIDAVTIISRFLQWKQTKHDKSVVMHVLYTGQESTDGVNGIAPMGVPFSIIGGVCAEVSNGMIINSLYNDYYSRNGADQHKLDATNAHEMGHSFGAPHDPPNAYTEDPNGNDAFFKCKFYLMSPYNDKRANLTLGFAFSPCAIAKMSAVLQDPARRKCFVDPPADVGPFCGNALVEPGEECDCGNKYYCGAQNSCCNSYDSGTGPPCTYRVDRSNCTMAAAVGCTGGQCQYRNLPNTDSSCPCPTNTSCPCGTNGQCLSDECHSSECTRVGLRECTCPAESANGCRTCCEFDGECAEATLATSHALKSGHVKWKDLEKAGVKSKKMKAEIHHKFCTSDKDKCIWLMFRRFPRGDFCLWRGHVGKCTVHGKCLVETEILQRQHSMILKRKT